MTRTILINGTEFTDVDHELAAAIESMYREGIRLQQEQLALYDAVREMRLKEQTAKAMDRGNYWNLYCAAKRALYNMIPGERVEQLELVK